MGPCLFLMRVTFWDEICRCGCPATSTVQVPGASGQRSVGTQTPTSPAARPVLCPLQPRTAPSRSQAWLSFPALLPTERPASPRPPGRGGHWPLPAGSTAAAHPAADLGRLSPQGPQRSHSGARRGGPHPSQVSPAPLLPPSLYFLNKLSVFIIHHLADR